MEVDPDKVRKVAGTVGGMAEALRHGFASRSTALAPMDGRAADWSAAGAVTGWDALARRLGGAAAFLGGDLLTSAADFEATDREAAVVIATTVPDARVVGP